MGNLRVILHLVIGWILKFGWCFPTGWACMRSYWEQFLCLAAFLTLGEYLTARSGMLLCKHAEACVFCGSDWFLAIGEQIRHCFVWQKSRRKLLVAVLKYDFHFCLMFTRLLMQLKLLSVNFFWLLCSLQSGKMSRLKHTDANMKRSNKCNLWMSAFCLRE